MSHLIVIGGKGGTGKTTIAALATLFLSRQGRGSVLAVDADPNSNFPDALGARVSSTIADVIDAVAKDPGLVPQSMGKDSFIEYRIHQDIGENEGFDLLVMGRPEGPGCYCYANNVLRNVMAKLTKEYAFVIIDNEAGMEHFSRKTTRACDDLLVVCDESAAGRRAAQRILELTDALGIAAKRRILAVNRASGRPQADPAQGLRVDRMFEIPYDPEVAVLSARGASLRELPQASPARRAVAAIGEALWQTN